MRITEIETRLLAVDASRRWAPAPRPSGAPLTWLYPLVTIRTDGEVDGYSMGYGAHGDGRAVAEQIHSVYAAHILGADPLQSEQIWHALHRLNRHLYGLTDTVLGVIDVALWDIRGKVAGLPLWQLLGGYRDRLPSYQSVQRFHIGTPQLVEAEAKRAKDAGFRGLKLQMWDGYAGDVPRLAAAREAVGQDFLLMHDPAGGYDYVSALAVGRVLDDLGYHWFEEPIPDGQVDLLGRLGRQVRTPILAGETVRLDGIGEYLRTGVVPMIRGDVNIKGGVTGLQKAIAASVVVGARLEIHTAATPLLDLANLHVACATRSCELFETHHPIFRFALAGDPFVLDADGCVRAPTGPGLGADLDWAWIDDHTVDPPRVSSRASA